MTNRIGRKSGKTTKVRKQVRVEAKYGVMTKETSWTDRVKIYSTYMRNKPKRPVTAKI